MNEILRGSRQRSSADDEVPKICRSFDLFGIIAIAAIASTLIVACYFVVDLLECLVVD